RLVIMRKELFSPKRRNTPGVSKTSARPWDVRSTMLSFTSGKVVRDGSTCRSPRKTWPSAYATKPDLAEITGCPAAGIEPSTSMAPVSATIHTEFIDTSLNFLYSLRTYERRCQWGPGQWPIMENVNGPVVNWGPALVICLT